MTVHTWNPLCEFKKLVQLLNLYSSESTEDIFNVLKKGFNIVTFLQQTPTLFTE